VTADPLDVELQPGPESAAADRPILLYDGVCGLCNRFVQFVLRRDSAGVFRFASLQSALAGRILARHGAEARDLDTLYVAVDCELPGERVLIRSDAVIFVLKRLAAAAELRSAGQPLRLRSGQARAAVPAPARFTLWRCVGFVLQLVPRPLRDWGYRMVARNRYRIFGRSETCILPAPESRARFLDL